MHAKLSMSVGLEKKLATMVRNSTGRARTGESARVGIRTKQDTIIRIMGFIISIGQRIPDNKHGKVKGPMWRVIEYARRQQGLTNELETLRCC